MVLRFLSQYKYFLKGFGVLKWQLTPGGPSDRLPKSIFLERN